MTKGPRGDTALLRKSFSDWFDQKIFVMEAKERKRFSDSEWGRRIGANMPGIPEVITGYT